MRLIRCYIENFGVLERAEFEFDKNLTQIMQENGYGKTTLAAFIKAMFYGLEKTTKRSIDENERKKYTPWNGGRFGGNLEFEINGKKYKIERFFGAEDTFNLYDTETNKLSADFDENIGVKIFNIDADSYQRSVFMPQRETAVQITNDINAKLNSLLYNTDDLYSFDGAVNILEGRRTYYRKRRGSNDEITATEQKIYELNKKIDDCEDYNKQIKQLTQQNKQLELEIGDINKNLDSVQKDIIAAAKRSAYDQLKSAFDGKKNEAKSIEIFFSGNIPQQADIENCRKNIEELNNCRYILQKTDFEEGESAAYGKLKQIFGGGVPDDAQIEQAEKDLADYNRHLSMINSLAENESQSKDKGNKKESKSKLPVFLGIFSAATLIAGIFLISTVLPLAVLFIALCVISALGAGGLLLKDYTDKRISDSKLQSGRENLLYERNRLTDIKGRLDKFFSPYFSGVNDYFRALQDIKGGIERYGYFIKKERDLIEKRREISGRMGGIESAVKAYLSPFKYNREMTYNEMLQTVNENYRDYNKIIAELKDSEKKLADYVKENDMASVINDSGLSENELLERKKQISAKLAQLNSLYIENQTKINNLSGEYQKITDYQSEKEVLSERLRQYKYNCNMIDFAMEYLRKAKENLSKKYLGKMQQSFLNYADKITGGIGKAALNEELEITIERYGENKQADYFSCGFRAIFQICARLALIESLFEEKPFIILDDPFVNLDDNKAKQALNILKELSSQTQIIYLVCHSSRQIM